MRHSPPIHSMVGWVWISLLTLTGCAIEPAPPPEVEVTPPAPERRLPEYPDANLIARDQADASTAPSPNARIEIPAPQPKVIRPLTFDGGLPDAAAEQDAHVPHETPPCRRYCEALAHQCPGEVVTMEACARHCATWTDSASGEGDVGADTLGCRLAVLAQDFDTLQPGQKASACAAAGPLGGGICGSVCTVYCRLVETACPALFPEDELCTSSCRTWPNDGDVKGLNRDTAWCRTAAAARALNGDTRACAEASAGGGSLCVDGPPCALGIPCPDGLACTWPTGQCDGLGSCQRMPEALCDGVEVCGCDGITWPDRCAAAGVGIQAVGPCPPLPCDDAQPCPSGAICSRPEGQCGGPGQCTARPSHCEGPDAPVCGCDGRTHRNACEAARAMTTVMAQGPCPPGPCLNARDCGFGQWCSRPAGQCGGQGECAPLSTACAQPGGSVCGCDRRSYDDACAAATAGTTVRLQGECVCEDNAQCAQDHRCTKAQCGDATGRCVARPDACPAPREGQQVCGCDGRTWPSECHARQNGVDVRDEGPCPSSRCTIGDPLGCPDGQACQSPQGMCRGVGVCTPAPQCPRDIFDPVCGCDGQTWRSACHALAAGRSVAYRGICGRPCDHSAACGPDGFCGCLPDAPSCEAPTCIPCTARLQPLPCGDEVLPDGLCTARDLGLTWADLDAGRCDASP
ncbi:MAG: Kazal-type serine protease inhibitor domain-containing protein [Bradymonadia bacterium]